MAKAFVPDLCQKCARCDDCSKQRLVLELHGDTQINTCGIYLAKSNVGKGDNPSPPDVPTILQPTQKP